VLSSLDKENTVSASATLSTATSASTAKISLKDVHYTVDSLDILKGITLDVKEGEILCVMGLSGSGKSTLIRCIAGLIKPTQGQLFIGGEDIVPMKEVQLLKMRAKIGFVFQYAALFDSMNVLENIAFGILRGSRRTENRNMSQREVMRRVAELLQAVGLPGIERRMPADLSGGMRRRVGLARALATNPEIILYDEPTSGLDPVTAASIDALILSTRDQHCATSIVVSHDMESVYHIADKVLMIYEGLVQAYGTPQEIQETNDPIVRQFIRGEVDGPIQVRK
jgi:phospholipid/cholesterol/gamma-HCH transport system ATP-binding protein